MNISNLKENIGNRKKVVEMYCEFILDASQNMIDDEQQILAQMNAEIIKHYGQDGFEKIKREVLGNYGCVA